MSSQLLDHGHRPTLLGRADSSATGSSSYTQTTRSSSAATNYVLHSPSTTAESSVQSPKPSHLPPAAQSAFKQQTHPTMLSSPAEQKQPSHPSSQSSSHPLAGNKPPLDIAAEDVQGAHTPWKLEFRGVVRFARWVSAKGNTNASASSSSGKQQQQQRSRPLRPKKPLTPIQPPSLPAADPSHPSSPPLASPINHRRTTFDIVSPLVAAAAAPSEMGTIANPTSGSTNNNNNVTAPPMTLPPFKFTRGLSLIEALDVPPSNPTSSSSPPPSILSAPSTLSGAEAVRKPHNQNGKSRPSTAPQGTHHHFHNNVNNAQSRQPPARASTPGRDPIAEERFPSGAPHNMASKVIRLDERTVVAGGVVVLNSDASRSGSPSLDGSAPPARPVRARKQQRAPRPILPKPTPSQVDDEDDVFFTGSSRQPPLPQPQHRFPTQVGQNTIAYVDEDEDDDDDDDDEYEYDSPKAWRRMSGVDRVHARRERRRKGVSGFRNSMQLDGSADDDYPRGPHNEGGNPAEDNEKVPRSGSFPVMMAAAAPSRAEEGASSSGERVVVVQFEQEAPPLKQFNSDGQGFVVSPPTTTTPTIRPRPPRPLPPIPIIGLNNHHIRLSTEGAEDEEDQKKRRLLAPTLNSAAAATNISLASPSSTVFSHSQGILPNGGGLGAVVVGSRKNRTLLSAPPPSDNRFSVVSAEWVKVDAEALLDDMDANEFGMTSSSSNGNNSGNGGSRRFGSFGRKSYSEAGHGGAPPVTTSNRFLFPFFSSSPASEEEEDRSSSLHTTVVDHRFFPFQTAVSDLGHGGVGGSGSSGPSSPRRSGDAAEVLASGGAGKRDSFLLRSKSARLPQRVSMIEDTGSDIGHGAGGAVRRVSKKAIIVGEREPVVKRKQSAGNVLKDRLRSSFGLKKVLGGADGETTGSGGGGFFGSGKGKEKEKQLHQQPPPRSSTPRPQTPAREIRLDDDLAEEVTPSSKATRRKSVLVKKRPSTAVPEGFEKGNPKSRSTTSLGLGKERKSSSTPRPSMTSDGKPENIPLPSTPGSGSTVDGSPSRRASTSATTPLSRRFTGKFGSQKKRNRGGSLGSSAELGVGSVSDAGHGQGHSRVVSEAVATGRRRGSTSGGSGFMAGFFSGLSMTSITSSSNVNRIPVSPSKSGKLTKPNPLAANLPTSWSPSYGLGRGHSTSSSTFFGGGAATPASILNVTAPGTPESPYIGLSESPIMSTVPLRSTSPSPLSTTTPRRSSSSLLFSTPKALKRISEGSRFETSPMSISSVVETAENADGEEEGPDTGTPKGWVKVKPRRSVSSFIPAEDDIPPVPPIPAALASQVLMPAPPLVIPGRRPLPPPPVVVNPDTVHKKAPLVSLAYTGKQGYYAHEEARLQLQREIAEEDPETPPSTTAHGEDAEPNPDISVEYPLTPRLKENILRAHLYTSPSSPTAKLSSGRMGSMYAFPRTESTLDDDLVMFKPNRPHLPHRQSSASAKRWTLAVNQIPDDSEFLKEIDDLRKSRQEIATASRRASFRKTVEGDVAEDDPCSDGELDEGSDEEGVWMKARRAMLTVREMMRTETSYRNHLVRLWEADSANPTPVTPPTFLAHLPSLISASTLLSSRLEEDPSAWGVSAAFLGAEDALEKAFAAWCGVVGQVMLELAGNTPPISTSASRTSLYNRKSSTGPRDVLDKEKQAPKRADTIASSISGGSASGKPGKKPKSRPGSTFGIGPAPYSTGSKPLSVQDIAIMPSQRVPRYVLLFKDLLEQTPVTSPSRALVERALQGAMRIAKNCDDAQQHSALTIPSP